MPASADMAIEEFEHTADPGIQVLAPDLARLFEGAARGLFGMVAELERYIVDG